MSEYLKNFESIENYKNWLKEDNRDFPSISFIKGGTVKYDKEIVMRWYDADTAKVPYISGTISHEEFVDWVDSASMPCEIKKDGTDFNYLLLSDFSKTATDHTGLVEKGRSHYNTTDKTDYLQMTELKQVNVGLFQNTKEGWKEVHFNFDLGCPDKFHKWFAHPYWNEEIGCYTKLWGRYDVTPVTHTSKAAEEGINCCYGETQGGFKENNTLVNGNWSIALILNSLKINNKLLHTSYWETLILGYLHSLYYKTYNSQSIAKGIYLNYEFLNGLTDTIKSPHGKIVQEDLKNEPYRFMHLENSLYGKQWIWGAGIVTDGEFLYKMTIDDIKSNGNNSLYFDKINSDITGTYLKTDVTGSFIPIYNIDIFGMPQQTTNNSSIGFYDQIWEMKGNNRICLVGGYTWSFDTRGTFCRDIGNSGSLNGPHLRFRITMNR